MSDRIGYDAAVQQYLQQILNIMVQSSMINRQIADQLANTAQQWTPYFVNEMPSGDQTLSEPEFKRLLQEFLMRQAQRMMSSMNTGYPMAGYGGGMPGYGAPPMAMPGGYGGYGQPAAGTMLPPPVSTGYGAMPMGYGQPPNAGYGGGPGYGAQPMNPGASPHFFVPGTPAAPSTAAVPRPAPAAAMAAELKKDIVKEAEPVRKSGVPVGYTPAWVANPDLVNTSDQESMGDLEFAEWHYPGGDVDLPITYAMLNSNGPIGDVYDVCSILKRYYPGDRAVLAKVTHLEVMPIRNAKMEDLDKAIESLKKVCSTTQESVLDRMQNVLGFLETQPQNVYSTFSKLIIKLFNRFLKGRLLQAKKNHSIDVEVGSISDILEFAVSANNSAIEPLTSVPGYANAYEKVLSLILSTLNNLKVDPSREAVLAAAKKLGGKEGLRWERRLNNGIEDVVTEFGKHYSVITYKDSYVLSNLDFASVPSTAELFQRSDMSVVLLEQRTGNFDHIVNRTFGNDMAVPVYSMIDGNPEMLIGSCMDIGQVYVKL